MLEARRSSAKSERAEAKVGGGEGGEGGGRERERRRRRRVDDFDLRDNSRVWVADELMTEGLKRPNSKCLFCPFNKINR